MDYERKNGRIPEDVYWENLGFDIRSREDSETRYIEVKGRARAGFLALSPNKWIKARRLGNQYWLYIVVVDRKMDQNSMRLMTSIKAEANRGLRSLDTWFLPANGRTLQDF
jgi:hypothetical protein